LTKGAQANTQIKFDTFFISATTLESTQQYLNSYTSAYKDKNTRGNSLSKMLQ